MGRVLEHRRDAAQHLAAAEGDFDAAADFDRLLQFGRDEVVELFAQSQLERHASDHTASKTEIGRVKKAKGEFSLRPN